MTSLRVWMGMLNVLRKLHVSANSHVFAFTCAAVVVDLVFYFRMQKVTLHFCL